LSELVVLCRGSTHTLIALAASSDDLATGFVEGDLTTDDFEDVSEKSWTQSEILVCANRERRAVAIKEIANEATNETAESSTGGALPLLAAARDDLVVSARDGSRHNAESVVAGVYSAGLGRGESAGGHEGEDDSDSASWRGLPIEFPLVWLEWCCEMGGCMTRGSNSHMLSTSSCDLYAAADMIAPGNK
jgi:hypothetical protein